MEKGVFMEINEISTQTLQEFLEISEATGEGLTHFVQSTRIGVSRIEGKGRFILNDVYKNELIGIISGILVNTVSDPQITMPIGPGLYLNQISINHRAVINHSCEPNLTLQGFNKLIANKDLRVNTELTVDYGTMFVGNGCIIIKDCLCGSLLCRKTIRTNDYLLIPEGQLGAYAYWTKNKSIKSKIGS